MKTSIFSIIGDVLIFFRSGEFSQTGGFARHWLDYAKHSLGGSTPDEVVEKIKSLFRMSLLYLTFVPYWVCHAQVGGYLLDFFEKF